MSDNASINVTIDAPAGTAEVGTDPDRRYGWAKIGSNVTVAIHPKRDGGVTDVIADLDDLVLLGQRISHQARTLRRQIVTERAAERANAAAKAAEVAA